MIILIGGASHTGKTKMAQDMLTKFLFPYLSVDQLKKALYLTDVNCGYAPEDSDEFVEKKLWEIIKEIININIERRQDIIIEGGCLFPYRLKELEDIEEQITPIFLGFSEEYVNKYFESRIIKYENVIQQRRLEEYITKEQLIRESGVIKQQCADAGIKYYEIKDNYIHAVGRAHLWANRRVSEILKAEDRSIRYPRFG